LVSLVDAIKVKCTNLSLYSSRLLTTMMNEVDFKSSLEYTIDP